ncbi:MAG: UPF0280 family protein [bacterium]
MPMRWKRHHLEIKESIMSVLCKAAFIESGRKAIMHTRRQIEDIIAEYPDFKTTHAPLKLSGCTPSVIKKMCVESKKVEVGPMAAVAGTIADECLKTMIHVGAREAVVDNGGDIALFIRSPVNIGIYSGKNSPLNLAFQIKPRNNSLGICTSSGTVGHSFSYGKANAAVVISENIVLADAAATAIANRVSTENDLTSCFEILNKLPEIEGSLVILNDKISLWGKLPRIIKSNIREELITKGQK